MNILDFFKPKWKHSNPRIRLEAIVKLNDQNVLGKIVINDMDMGVRLTAVKKLTDLKIRREVITKLNNQNILSEIVKNDTDMSVRLIAVKKLIDPIIRRQAILELNDQNILEEIAIYDKDINVRLVAIKKLIGLFISGKIKKNDNFRNDNLSVIMENDKVVLNELARSAKDYEKRLLALIKLTMIECALTNNKKDNKLNNIYIRYPVFIPKKPKKIPEIEDITDQYILGEIAKDNNRDSCTRLAAIKKLTNENIIIEILKNEKTSMIRRALVNRIFGQKELAKIVKNEGEINTRMDIIARITNPDILGEVAQKDKECIVRISALNKVIDQDILLKIAMFDNDFEVRKAAVSRWLK